MKTYLKREYGVWQICGNLKKLLCDCRAKMTTRYAISGIYVSDGVLASTDGRRLVDVKLSHKIEPDIYFCSKDGWLLSPIEGNFPKYEDIVPKEKDSRIVVETNGYPGSKVIGKIFGGLYSAGIEYDYALLKRPIEILSEIIDGKARVYVSKKKPAEHPFLIEAHTEIGEVRYVQMPIHLPKT